MPGLRNKADRIFAVASEGKNQRPHSDRHLLDGGGSHGSGTLREALTRTSVPSASRSPTAQGTR